MDHMNLSVRNTGGLPGICRLIIRQIDGITGKADIMNICAFEPDAMIIRIAVECHVKDHWRIEREIRARIKDRFDAEGIIMPHYSGHDFRYISYEN